MCRNIRPLDNFEPPATRDEVTAAALQYVRKVSGTTKPSQANQAVFDQAVREIAHLTPAPARGPGHHRAAEGPRGRGRQGARPGRAAVRPLTARPRPTRLDVERRSTLLAGRPLVVLSGAGLSTDSGIPDYRGRARRAEPMTYQEFIVRAGGPAALLGAQPPGLAPDAAAPSPTTDTARWPGWTPDAADHPERRRPAPARRAPRLVELHGRLADVVCLGCGDVAPARRCTAAGRRSTPASPSGTPVDSRPTATSSSTTPRTSWCPTARAAAACSSPTWCSSARTCRRPGRRCFAPVDALAEARRAAGAGFLADGAVRAAVRAPRGEAGTPVVIVNRGPTRGDALAAYRLDAGCS